MKKIITKYALLAAFALVAMFGLVGHNIAHAQEALTVSDGSVFCRGPMDCEPSATGVTYAVSFTTNDNNTASKIQVTFPDGYTITNSSLNILAPDNTPNAIKLNGTNIGISGTSVSGNTIIIDLSNPTDLSTGTVSFQISDGGTSITNPSETGTTGDLTIDTDAIGENAQTDVPGVVIASLAPMQNPISNFTVSGNSSDDLGYGASPAGYTFNFQSTTPIGFSPIAITFPTGYSLQQGSISPSVICFPVSNGGCANQSAEISASGSAYMIDVESVSVSGNVMTINLGRASNGPEDSPETISFSVVGTNPFNNQSDGVTNPSTFGTTGDFSLSFNGGTAITTPGVTIAPPPDHLVFTTEPGCSAENDSENPGDCISGEAFSTQPVVTVEDYTGATDTNYNGDVTIFLGGGQGSLSGTFTEQAVNGVATFTNVNYHAGQDRESVILGANATDGSGQGETGITDGTANSFRSDVVATRFKLTDQHDDSDGTINLFTGNSGDFRIIATDADGNFADTDYDPESETFTLTDSSEALLSTHISPNGTAPTIPSSNDIVNSIPNGFVSITFTKTEALGPITVSDGTLSGSSDPVDVKTLANNPSFDVTPSTLTPTAGTPFDLTLKATDQYGNILNDTNTEGAYTGYIFISTDASTPYNLNPNLYQFQTSDEAVKTFVKGVTLNTVENGVAINITVQRDGGLNQAGTVSGINVEAAPVSSGGGGGGGGGGGVNYGGGSATSNNVATVNDGAISTTNPQVTLSLFSSSATRVMVSGDPGFAGATWQPYSITKPWTLPGGSGRKTVYVKFMDATGAVSSVSQSVITLESAPGQPAPAPGACPNGMSYASSCAAPGPAPAPAAFARNLRRGMAGPDVALLQRYLGTHGFPVTAIGHETKLFGPTTQRELKAFQKSAGLSADGSFGPATRAYANAHQ